MLIYNTLQEMETLQHQLQETADEKTRKHLQEKMTILQARKELADSKGVWLYNICMMSPSHKLMVHAMDEVHSDATITPWIQCV